MASVRDLVENGFDEGLVKQAVDAAGFERKRGRGGLNLDAKGVTKVVKAYNALLAKLTAKASKFNPDKLDYGTDEDEAPAPKAKAEKKTAPKAKAPAKAPKAKAKPVDEDEDEDDEIEDPVDDDDDVEEADTDDDDE
jgi:hypothetical protein